MPTQNISKTITVPNAAHLDEVTIRLDLEVNCSCRPSEGSYTRSEPTRR